jgi:hypothetical protein
LITEKLAAGTAPALPPVNVVGLASCASPEIEELSVGGRRRWPGARVDGGGADLGGVLFLKGCKGGPTCGGSAC